MTYKEAADILDPETRIEILVEIGYYNGFNSDKAQSDAVFARLCRVCGSRKHIVPSCNQCRLSWSDSNARSECLVYADVLSGRLALAESIFDDYCLIRKGWEYV